MASPDLIPIDDFSSLSLYDDLKVSFTTAVEAAGDSQDGSYDSQEVSDTGSSFSELPMKPVPPFVKALHAYKEGVNLAFSSANDFAAHHLAGAEIENENDKRNVEMFNNTMAVWDAWILAPTTRTTPLDGYQREWVLVVQGPRSADIKFPGLDERCTASFTRLFTSIQGTKMDLKNLRADRIDNPFETAGLKNKSPGLAAFHFLPTFDNRLGKDEDIFKRFTLTTGLTAGELQSVQLSKDKKLLVMFRLDFNDITFKVEKNAMSAFLDVETKMKQSIRTAPPHTEAYSRELGMIPPNGSYFDIDPRQAAAFKYILDPRVEPDGWMDIFQSLPHMFDPVNNAALPKSLRERFSELNSHHKRAYKRMMEMPCGLHFVSGCPGAGKTHWNVLTATIAMAGFKANGKRPKILYIIDMNKPVDDVANRIVKLCSDAHIPVKMVRMRGWRREMENSELINNDWRHQTGFEVEGSKALADRFLTMAQGKSTVNGTPKASKGPGISSSCAAPSLDQACWDHFVEHIDKYGDLAKNLAACLRRGVETKVDSEYIRRQIKSLYLDTLATVDFVATTPVAAASPEFISMFDPDLVFMDEAPHARELTSLVPIAMYRPKAWIYTGDFRQTQPYVIDAALKEPTAKGFENKFIYNPHAKQLRCSTMERIEILGGRVNTLMINHRAFGDLQRLSSKLFYDKRMSGAYARLAPTPSATYLRAYLSKLVGVQNVEEPRIFVHIKNASQSTNGFSKFNSAHEDFAIACIKPVLASPHFRNVKSPTSPGRILIIAPYRAAVQNYYSKLRMLLCEHSDRVDIRTIDTAQGHEADLVILDLVRTDGPGFLNDRHRLNVAITRARQAEIILMHPGMTGKVRKSGTVKRAEILTDLWKDANKRGLIVQI